MTIRRYGDRPGWWIAPDTDPAGKAKRLAALVALCVAVAGLSLPVVARSAPRPAGTAWGLAPAAATGTYPRPDAYCAARVQHYPERVAANATANATIPPAGTDFRWGPWANQTPEMAYNFSRVDGNFSGTTDEILEWAACKWGMDHNIAKAEAIAESSWQQSTVGDNGDSYGILQVRAAPAGSPASADNGWGGYPWTQKSTALNADAQMAYLRAVYDGRSYMGNGGNGSPVLKGNIWNAVSAWQSGSDTGPDWYTQQVRRYLASQAWQRPYPPHSAALTAMYATAKGHSGVRDRYGPSPVRGESRHEHLSAERAGQHPPRDGDLQPIATRVLLLGQQEQGRPARDRRNGNHQAKARAPRAAPEAGLQRTRDERPGLPGNARRPGQHHRPRQRELHEQNPQHKSHRCPFPPARADRPAGASRR